MTGRHAEMSFGMLEETFYHCCQLLVQQSQQLRDSWSWVPLQGSQEGYLKKTQVRSVVIKLSPVWDQAASSSDPGSHGSCHSQFDPQKKSAHVAPCDADSVSSERDDDDDDDGLCTVSEDSIQVLQYEYHILYSCSYRNPVLYFRVFTLEGRSLSLEDVWRSVHPNFRLQLQNSPLNTISQQEHPLLGQPFFMLHPCRTEEFMRPVVQAAQEQHRPMNYVLTWLSVVGPLLGLDVPLKYHTQLQSAAGPSSTEPG
ncbi:ubiquitin-like-conjugating enzyme ATG10 isoform X1 [Solea solea]|uniref:ubiquitin-like-conjugating enzyme ATG10 isoform X1 n=1 Tax=Solea solea TaxID=90069 RepID=UPI00272B2F30|nr:ubiquitin-like-conjugating enzyme ATG10 isoform X1 [Solea solea]